jgi:arginine/lysine/ornithine decarboxylase
MLSRARPDFVPPIRHPVLGMDVGFDEEYLLASLAAASSAAAIHLTRPDFYGFAPDISRVIRAAHAHEIPVIVDEAHGAHFQFDDRLPGNALAAGADIVIQSPHKSLGSLTQSALLHVQGALVDRHRLATELAQLQSSSPSALLTASLDCALQHMKRRGRELWRRAVDLAVSAASALPVVGDGMVVGGTGDYDVTKLVLDVRPCGLSGFAGADVLREKARLYAEFADLRHIVFSIGLADTKRTVHSLVRAVERELLSERRPPASLRDVPVLPRPQRAMDGYAALERRRSPVPLAAATGRTSAELVIAYPPGIPLLAPGEIVTEQTTDVLRALQESGCRILISDPSAASIVCVDQ